MNFLGKILIILNFVLSVAYLAVSGVFFTQRVEAKDKGENVDKQKILFIDFMRKGSYRNRDEVANAKAQGSMQDFIDIVATVQTDIETTEQKLKAAVSAKVQEVDLKGAEISNLKGEIDKIKTSEQDAIRARGEAENERKRQSTLVEHLTARVDDLIALRDAATGELQTVKEEQKQIYIKYLDVVTQADKFKDEVRAAKLDNQVLVGKVEKADTVLSSLKKLYPDVYRQIVESQVNDPKTGIKPLVRGRVVAVNPELAFVVINKGAPDNVAKGDSFIVYRGSDYVGRVEIDKVDGEFSCGKIVFKRLPVQQGDEVANRLE